MEKRGMSHIEMIASFALFVGFLLFGLYFFNPLDNQRVFDSTLYYTFDSLENNASSRSVSYGVALRQDIDAPAVVVDLSRGDVAGEGVYVEDSRGQRAESARAEQGIAFIRSGGDNFFQIRFGDFPYIEGSVPSPEYLMAERDYTVSSSEELELMDETKLLSLAEDYRADYAALKTRFNIPNRVDFGFTIAFSESDKIEAVREIPEDIESFSQTKRLRFTRQDGSTAFADVTVVVW